MPLSRCQKRSGLLFAECSAAHSRTEWATVTLCYTIKKSGDSLAGEDIQTLTALELELSRLAALFRGASLEKRMAVAALYRQQLDSLHTMGWNESLPPEDELPEEDMPEWYLRRLAARVSPEDWKR